MCNYAHHTNTTRIQVFFHNKRLSGEVSLQMITDSPMWSTQLQRNTIFERD